jgi:hypothetical protein
MKYSQQLYYKQNEVFNHLQRIGKVELPEFEPFWVEKTVLQKQNGIFFFRTADG